MKNNLPVAIIGGGPVGLAAAAQLAIRDEPFVLFEAGAELGRNFLDYAHVQLFSTWEYNIDKAAKSLLEKNGVKLPDAERLPYGGEIVSEYLKPLGELPEIKPYTHLNSRILHVSRSGLDKMKSAGRDSLPFILEVEMNGDLAEFEAKAVIDATGTWQNPNPVVSGGRTDKDSTVQYRIPDIMNKDNELFMNKNVAVVGSGHSAFNSILDLLKLNESAPETRITWILRRELQQSLFGGGTIDQLEARGALGSRLKTFIEEGRVHIETGAHIRKLNKNKQGQFQVTIIQNNVSSELGPFDEIIANTGSRPNFDFLGEIRYAFDPSLESVPALAPLIDPNIHSCGTVRPHGEKELRQPEKDFYIVGAKSYGRAPTFLMATGYEQVRSVVAYLTGDEEAAKRVELSLPETGVCSSKRTVPLQFNIKTVSCC